MRVGDFLARLGDSVRPAGEGRWTARCPAHEDRTPSLSVAVGKDERILVFCHAGCTVRRIVEAMGLRLRDLFPNDVPRPSTPAVRRTRMAEEFIRTAMREAEGRLADLYRETHRELMNGGWERVINGDPAAKDLACRAARLSWWEYLLDECLAGDFSAFVAAAEEVAKFGSLQS